jgi:hypothetical protein
VARDDAVLAVDQHRVGEAVLPDRARDQRDLRLRMRPGVPGIGDQRADRAVDTLSSWLDRTLASQTGPGRRMSDAGARSAFDLALGQYTHEATRIIREFAPGWYGKRLHESGRIDSHQAAAFGAVAMKKITEELRRKRNADE